MENNETIIMVQRDGRIVIGQGYSIGEVLDALERARRVVLGVVLRPVEPTEPPVT